MQRKTKPFMKLVLQPKSTKTIQTSYVYSYNENTFNTQFGMRNEEYRIIN